MYVQLSIQKIYEYLLNKNKDLFVNCAMIKGLALFGDKGTTTLLVKDYIIKWIV